MCLVAWRSYYQISWYAHLTYYINSEAYYNLDGQSLQHSLERFTTDLLNLLHASHISLVLLQHLTVRDQLRILRTINLASTGDEWEAHHDVGRCQIRATKVFAAIWRCRELGFQKTEMCLEILRQEHRIYAARDRACDWLD
jgi:hypothetical protein